jgi:hypothetical protein
MDWLERGGVGMKIRLLALLIVAALPVAAYSTPYVSPEEAARLPEREDRQVLWSGPAEPLDYSYDPLDRYEMAADFIVTMQVSDTSLATYGGMREGEHMLGVIQTDNTSESIWIWTHYYSLTGNDTYRDNIDAAWEYCMNFPAHSEEGGDSRATGYYRVYNCSWALRAEMEYRQVYGDTTYAAYAESCASYLCHHPMYLYIPTGMYKRLNGMIMGWAVGNLYEYGQYVGNPVYVQRAVDFSDSVKTWVETNPNKLHWKEWAMNGGAVMWGLVNSYFAEYPAGMEAWVEANAPYLDSEVDSSTYQNAWRAWAALGQSTASQVLDSDVYGAFFEHLADTLVQNDGDLDGGIPVIDAEPDDHDQSWVTNYLGFMCMDRLLATADVTAQPRRPERLRVVATPRPSSGLPRLLFSLGEASPIEIDVFDVAGRSVMRRSMGVLERGAHSVALSTGDKGLMVSPGIYFYAVRSKQDVANGKIIVLR